MVAAIDRRDAHAGVFTACTQCAPKPPDAVSCFLEVGEDVAWLPSVDVRLVGPAVGSRGPVIARPWGR